jgi:hypothetical protein
MTGFPQASVRLLSFKPLDSVSTGFVIRLLPFTVFLHDGFYSKAAGSNGKSLAKCPGQRI